MKLPPLSRPFSSRARTRGALLIVAMWILLFLAAWVLVLARSMRSELHASANQAASIRAAAVERGAEQYAAWLIDQQADTVLTLAEANFAAIPIGEGYCWMLRWNHGDSTLPAYGLVDEASKINLNTAVASMLLALPGMTTDLAAAVVDWRDADSDPTAGGAEDEYYLALPQPYHVKNGPLETVEEVLLVRGFTADLLYGWDGFNGGIASGSAVGGSGMAGGGTLSSVQGDQRLARGLYEYLTISSNASGSSSTAAASASASSGSSQRKVNVNGEDTRQLFSTLSSLLGSARASEITERGRPRPPFRSLFDFAIRSGLTPQELDTVSDRLSTEDRPSTAGLINVNTASREVLLCLPGLTDAEVTSLVTKRQSAGSLQTGLGWILEALGPKAIPIGNLITTHAYQYAADLVAVTGDGRAFRRCHVIFDGRQSPPRITHRADLTELGWPLDPQILLSLRSGRGLPASVSSTLRGAF